MTVTVFVLSSVVGAGVGVDDFGLSSVVEDDEEEEDVGTEGVVGVVEVFDLSSVVEVDEVDEEVAVVVVVVELLGLSEVEVDVVVVVVALLVDMVLFGLSSDVLVEDLAVVVVLEVVDEELFLSSSPCFLATKSAWPTRAPGLLWRGVESTKLAARNEQRIKAESRMVIASNTAKGKVFK